MKGIHVCFILLLSYCTSFAQNNVGIGTTSPAQSAKLDISSTTQGFLPPRMTYIQRNAISTPVAGLMVWCTDCTTTGEMQVYNGSAWQKLTVSSASVPMGVGGEFGGGIIAYIFQPGDPGYVLGQTHGLIAAPSDQSVNAEWGCAGDLTGANGIALGTGQENTTEIVGDCSEMGIAARICNNLVLGGFIDWYLPSKNELNKLYLNRIAIGGFVQNIYWSSSEIDETESWAQSFIDGDAGAQLNFPKNFDVNVGAIRSF